jgi:O-antigen ligase
VKSVFVWVTALLLGALFLIAALFATVELWRESDLLGNPKTKIAAAWFMSAAVFLAIGLRGWRGR